MLSREYIYTSPPPPPPPPVCPFIVGKNHIRLVQVEILRVVTKYGLTMTLQIIYNLIGCARAFKFFIDCPRSAYEEDC